MKSTPQTKLRRELREAVPLMAECIEYAGRKNFTFRMSKWEMCWPSQWDVEIRPSEIEAHVRGFGVSPTAALRKALREIKRKEKS